ncbi:delta(14)-sterol reductase [Purpureocillium lilacinum]|uniref:Delta(14)-sterol reductase n=1 Tax=Purpureocillium lilacinum TaxID=33203 RepID=A0A179HD82_PURLI|nr:delta(14)-sterol reductase [Purpureocillium lilacinum]
MARSHRHCFWPAAVVELLVPHLQRPDGLPRASVAHPPNSVLGQAKGADSMAGGGPGWLRQLGDFSLGRGVLSTELDPISRAAGAGGVWDEAVLACAVGTALYGADFVVWTFIDRNYLQILTANILLAYAISLFVYVRSFSVKPRNEDLRELARGGTTGSIIYDFYIGRELNPRITLPLIGEVDLKAWLEMRPGLTGWLLLDLAFIARQYRLYGYVSDSIVLVALVQGYYVLEGQYAEAGILGMIDITTDGLGYMLTFGDIVWVPFLYSTQCRYLSVFPVHLGWAGIAAIAVVFSTGLYIFRSSNNQKALFRTQPDHPSVKDMPYIQTKRGTRLLTGGWWGAARHVNYFGDWMQALPFSLPTAVSGYLILPAGGAAAIAGATGALQMLDGREVVQGAARGWGIAYTYLYVVYFAVLLIHRERRDDALCAEKYGEDWDKYRRTVRWRILPGVY